MRRILFVFGTVLIFLSMFVASPARAQGNAASWLSNHEIELFTGYSYLGMDTAITGARLNLNGASGSIAFLRQRVVCADE